MRKIPFARIELTSQRVRGLRGTSELPVFQKLQRRLSDVLPIHQKVIKKVTQKVFLAIGGLHEDKLCDTLQAMAPTK